MTTERGSGNFNACSHQQLQVVIVEAPVKTSLILPLFSAFCGAILLTNYHRLLFFGLQLYTTYMMAM